MPEIPAPRQPEYLHPLTAPEEIQEHARAAVRRNSGRGALGLVTKDDRVLLVAPPPPTQEQPILDAILDAYHEAGIDAQSVAEDEAGMVPPREQLQEVSAADGWKEITWRPENAAMLAPDLAAQRPETISDVGSGDPGKLAEYLDKHPDYTAVYVGAGGRPYWRWGMLHHGHRFRENWTYWAGEDLLSQASSFPGELADLIEKKTLEFIPEAAEVRLTDPQGTNLSFEVTEPQARLWATEAYVPGHLFLNPAVENREPVKDGDEVPPEHFMIPKANGVIAGTGNHVGYFPHMTFHVENGLVVRVEGGGLFGECIREVLERTKDLQYPHYPGPGYAYLVEIASGTNPKEFRNRHELFDGVFPMPNLGERKRSGVLHFGVGVHPIHQDIFEFANAHNVASQHGFHIHTYFTTYRARLRSGEWRTIIENGRLTALDDPEVRALAARYGDPDHLLREDWVPSIPGINCPGDYQRDFAPDPASWIREETESAMEG
ncbi:MAG: hypothetical protein JOZ39_02065 [Chloroflexi bacterium]|nr:hypothetical protein [Chloroflexota bacterium]